MPSFTKIFSIIFLLFFLTANNVFASDNLLVNSDFDDWDSSGPVNWQKSASTNFSIENATGVALLKLTTSNYRYLYQTASVSGSTPYRLSGLIKNISGSAAAFLRLAWYCQGCTSQLSTDDSNAIDEVSDNFSEAFLEVTSPATAALARARIMVVPQPGFVGGQVLADKMFLAMVTTDSNSSAGAAVSQPQIDWSLGNEFELGDQFGANVSLKDFAANAEYYLKLRGGLDENSLNKVQTKNNSSFYGDTEAWGNFPLIKTGGEGQWSGEIFGQVETDKPAGDYKVRLRVHKKDTDSSYDSSLHTVKFIPPPKVDLATTLNPIDDLEATFSSPAADAEILGTSSAFLLDDILASPEATEIKTSKPMGESNDPNGLVLILVGVVSVSLACLPAFRKIHFWRYNQYNK